MFVLTSGDFLLVGDFRKLTPIFSFVLIILIIHRFAVLSKLSTKIVSEYLSHRNSGFSQHPRE